jgi:hypothetical protein
LITTPARRRLAIRQTHISVPPVVTRLQARRSARTAPLDTPTKTPIHPPLAPNVRPAMSKLLRAKRRALYAYKERPTLTRTAQPHARFALLGRTLLTQLWCVHCAPWAKQMQIPTPRQRAICVQVGPLVQGQPQNVPTALPDTQMKTPIHPHRVARVRSVTSRPPPARPCASRVQKEARTSTQTPRPHAHSVERGSTLRRAVLCVLSVRPARPTPTATQPPPAICVQAAPTVLWRPPSAVVAWPAPTTMTPMRARCVFSANLAPTHPASYLRAATALPARSTRISAPVHRARPAQVAPLLLQGRPSVCLAHPAGVI